MAGHLLTINLNMVNPLNYNGWGGELTDTHLDALAFQTRLSSYNITELKDKTATISNVINTIYNISEEAKIGDTVVIAYSGHGALDSETSVGEKDNTFDQCWCLYDGFLKDNHIKKCLAFFKKGVRVALFSDSCHSGSMYRNGVNYSLPIKAIPKNIQDKIISSGNAIRLIMSKKKPEKIECALKYFGACQENQYAQSTGTGGLFTKSLFSIYDSNNQYPYLTLFKKLLASGLMPPEQTPTYYNNRKNDKVFDYKKAFYHE